ncbi:MAG TPA: DUF6483 family protein [Candidatus Baltobacteraceae bacterium]|jgi:hypothetical protein|nr:DUF6483 family protein [Candidatus Baltobacteraceae bacterium]
MIRRDFIVRMIEEMGRALAQIRALRRSGRSDAARQVVDSECEKLAALGVTGIVGLSQTELLARVSEGQLAQTVHLRTSAVVTLLREAAEIGGDEDKPEEARKLYLKALHLLLEVLSQEDPAGFPEFVPGVEALVTALSAEPLPVETLTILMRHYEATGQFAKAEDALFSILDAVAADSAVIGFGRAFYERTLRRSDAALVAGNLPRSEALQGLSELERLSHTDSQ